MVFTGNGKGKTTAAVGMALRAVGHGLTVYMIHFLKGRDYGEFLAARYLPRLTVLKAGRDTFVNRKNPDPEDRQLARYGFQRARQAILSGEYDMVVLDEINVAVDYGLIPEKEVLELLKDRPAGIDLVLTGRGAPQELIEAADLVSEVREVSHHYAKGIEERKGIEY